MGLFEPQHLLIILVIALVIFGPGRISELGGSLGKGIRDFKKAMAEPSEAPTPGPVSPKTSTPTCWTPFSPPRPWASAWFSARGS